MAANPQVTEPTEQTEPVEPALRAPSAGTDGPARLRLLGREGATQCGRAGCVQRARAGSVRGSAGRRARRAPALGPGLLRTPWYRWHAVAGRRAGHQHPGDRPVPGRGEAHLHRRRVRAGHQRIYRFWGALTEGLQTGSRQSEIKEGGNFFEVLYSNLTVCAISARHDRGSAWLGPRHRRSNAMGAVRHGHRHRCEQGCLPVQLPLRHGHLTGAASTCRRRPIFGEYVDSFGTLDVWFHPRLLHDAARADKGDGSPS